MKKHTPGPWHYAGDPLTHRQFDIFAPNSSPNQHVCTVNNLSAEKLWKRDAETALMNARLISCAPELLAALVSICARINPNEQPGLYGFLRKDWEIAFGVINRATNQNP